MNEERRFNSLMQSLTHEGTLMHVGLILWRAAHSWPDSIAVICHDQQLTYRQLYTAAYTMAQKLRTSGVKPNDIVMIFWENSLEFYVAYFAAWHIGAIVAPLNVFLQEAELKHIIHDAQPAVLIISPTLSAKISSPLSSMPPLIQEVPISLSPDSGTIKDSVKDIPMRNVDHTAALLYTSGTTGFPKGVMLSSRNIITNAVQGISRLEVTNRDRVYCALPLFHSLPQNICVWANTILGSTAIIVPKIDRTHLLYALTHKPTLMVNVPALYNLFCLMKTVEFGPIRYFFSGGDALSDKTRAFFELLYQRKLCNGYGLTETSPFIAVDTDDIVQATNTVGKPFIGITCSIRNDLNQEVPTGTVGTLWVKGDNVMKGYYNAPEATAKVIQDGWLNTGDLAYINNYGKIVLAGRQRDLIVNKGIKIYPQEVENVLFSHPDVLQVGVVPMQEAQEQVPVAFIGTKNPHHEQLRTELIQLCQRNLAPYKVPRRIIIKRELPVTTTGKVDKKKLLAELQEQK